MNNYYHGQIYYLIKHVTAKLTAEPSSLERSAKHVDRLL